MIKPSQIREMIKDGNHEAIIDAFKQWKGFSSVEIIEKDVIADGIKLSDDELRLWLDWCEGL